MSEDSRIPIIELWSCLVVPLQGDITDAQAADLTSEVLHRIRRRRAKALVIDVSGLSMIDSHLCVVLAQVTKSARLMGARGVISGVLPEIAQTLQSMGLQLGGADTALGLEHALEMVGIRAAPSDEETSDHIMEEMLRPASVEGDMS
jgi:rsbT antagonist protein RsbS